MSSTDKKLYFTYPNFMRKAVTFSYDDGVVQDRKLIEILDAHGLKGTFNLNPGLFGSGKRLGRSEVLRLYDGHEVASHGYRHLHLDRISYDDAVRDIRDGRAALEDMFGRPVRGFASPYGEHGEAAVRAMRECGLAYARTVSTTKSFAPVRDWIRWNGTCHHSHGSEELADKFLADTLWGGCLALFYVWGHSYEFDNDGNWDLLERLCARFGGRADIWAATNIEIHDYCEACANVRASADGKVVQNLSSVTVYGHYGLSHSTREVTDVILPPGTFVDLGRVAGGTVTGEAIPKKDPVCQIFTEEKATGDLPKGKFVPTFPKWLSKAVTFSYDDGPLNDTRLVGIFNKHGLKCTFNLNGGGASFDAVRDPAWLETRKGVSEQYAGHEVAVHGAAHETWDFMTPPDVMTDVLSNRVALEATVGYPVTGCAYPCGSYAMSKAALGILASCGIDYSRTTAERWNEVPADFLEWNPTWHHNAVDDARLDEFLASKPECGPAVMYIWGHSFEFRTEEDWARMESICGRLAGRDDIWYATNIAICKYMKAVGRLEFSVRGDHVFNPTAVTVYGYVDGKPVAIPPGATV